MNQNKLEQAYQMGWIAAAQWAQRNDLISDIDSVAYCDDMTSKLAAINQSTTQNTPVCYQIRNRPNWCEGDTGWSAWEDCSLGAHEHFTKLTDYKNWQYDCRKLYVVTK